MAHHVVIAIEGVLARAGTKDAHLGAPILHGTGLFVALRQAYRLALLTTSPDQAKIEHWLATNGITGHTSLILPLSSGPIEQVRVEQLQQLRTRGYDIDLYMDAAPSAVAAAMRLGITGLVFASPIYARPEFRPDAQTTVRSWDEISAEVSKQNELRAQEPVRTADLPN